MSIYKDCKLCAFKRRTGCTRTGATTRLMILADSSHRKKTKCSHFKLSYKKNQTK